MRVQALEQARRLLGIPAGVADEDLRHAGFPGRNPSWAVRWLIPGISFSDAKTAEIAG
jgi:hypothetical protein